MPAEAQAAAQGALQRTYKRLIDVNLPVLAAALAFCISPRGAASALSNKNGKRIYLPSSAEDYLSSSTGRGNS